MFSLRNFVYDGLVYAIGKMETYQIMLNAAGWYEKGVLNDQDMEVLKMRIEAHIEAVEKEV